MARGKKQNSLYVMQARTIEDCEKKQANPSPCITVDPVPSLPPVVVPQDHGGDMHDHTVESPADDHHDDDNHEDGGDDIPESQPYSEPPPAPQLRRSTRVRKPSTRLSEDDFVLVTDGGEPETYDEAMSHVHREKWLSHPSQKTSANLFLTRKTENDSSGFVSQEPDASRKIGILKKRTSEKRLRKII
ncbi:unnamed protein product [Cuscuta campestris]|uniref:Uncharacterized protein n=1 Tax=Cuscuta campestris TaxID=132261 RepID=A0A484NMY6_9ASTE|nr:unnamed protein product [Cuscuta campestris]